jgi:hypothetical protein
VISKKHAITYFGAFEEQLDSVNTSNTGELTNLKLAKVRAGHMVDWLLVF